MSSEPTPRIQRDAAHGTARDEGPALPLLLAASVALGGWIARGDLETGLAAGPAILLAVGIAAEVHWRRIPEALTCAALALGLGFHGVAAAPAGAAGIGFALLGVGTAALLVAPAVLAGALARHEALVGVALGAWIGAAACVDVALFTVALRLATSVALHHASGELGALVHRFTRSAVQTLRNGRVIWFAPSTDDDVVPSLPFSLALGLALPFARLFGGIGS